VNPEIRFRVHPDIYRMADHRAQELGLSGAEAGRSAGVPLLARAALYEWLGLPWPDDLPRPLASPPTQTSLAPGSGKAHLTVHHSLTESYRRECLEQRGAALPSATTTVLELDPRNLPRELRRCLRLDGSGQLTGLLYLPDLECNGILTASTLTDYLARQRSLRPLQNAQEWEHTLASWAQREGSELLRARLEEGFCWLPLAELEWMRRQILESVGQSIELEDLRAEQSLAGEDWVHSLCPEREPSLERIQLLRAMRERCSAVSGLRLTLVRGSRDQIESRKRMTGPPFTALLWQLETPSGRQLGLLSHLS
jgi:hypothetical protein